MFNSKMSKFVSDQESEHTQINVDDLRLSYEIWTEFYDMLAFIKTRILHPPFISDGDDFNSLNMKYAK